MVDNCNTLYFIFYFILLEVFTGDQFKLWFSLLDSSPLFTLSCSHTHTTLELKLECHLGSLEDCCCSCCKVVLGNKMSAAELSWPGTGGKSVAESKGLGMAGEGWGKGGDESHPLGISTINFVAQTMPGISSFCGEECSLSASVCGFSSSHSFPSSSFSLCLCCFCFATVVCLLFLPQEVAQWQLLSPIESHIKLQPQQNSTFYLCPSEATDRYRYSDSYSYRYRYIWATKWLSELLLIYMPRKNVVHTHTYTRTVAAINSCT